ncbi:MAG: di-trans,poly-cis-decaprenylcistransferase [Deltaproteobacteria bacterium RBG_16_50_11]|nr:MAG: di-trans,poly-cis-decaprenylcistransferase [Deltaproteobacteria bacterium RBG_16_50_11]
MAVIDPNKLPRHIAIIMDGNGRWAKKKNLGRISGHLKGVDAVREVVTACRELGIKVLTLYAFSIENWKRPAEEVMALMKLLKEYLIKETEEMIQNNIRLNAIGRLEDLPPDVQDVLKKTMEKTEKCDGMILNLALSYGGRSEILHAIQGILSDFRKGRMKSEEMNIQRFSQYLWTKGLPDPDLLIRTSGELRVSNFLLWQIAYTELYVTETLWPDFDRRELLKAIADYQSRERRFGMTSEQLNGREE